MKTHDSSRSSKDQKDLVRLQRFIADCPNDRIKDAIGELVDQWLSKPASLPHFSEELRRSLDATDQEMLEIRWLLSINPNTPPSVLKDLCSGASSEVLERIAENPNTSPNTLADLSYQAVAEIRIAAAGNPSTPLASIMMLVTDENPDVRFSIAENPQVPAEALKALTDDTNPYVKMRATLTLARSEVERNVFGEE